jgi:hypothetical protein
MIMRNFWGVGVKGGVAIVALTLSCGAVFATDRPPQSIAEATSTNYNNSGGGQASSNLYSTDNSTAIGLGMAAAESVRIAPQCWRPARGFFKRPIGVLFVTVGGTVERDEECWAEYVKQAEHQRAMDLAKLELERERIKLESLRLSQCTSCELQK